MNWVQPVHHSDDHECDYWGNAGITLDWDEPVAVSSATAVLCTFLASSHLIDNGYGPGIRICSLHLLTNMKSLS
jgi:hypothetical protein